MGKKTNYKRLWRNAQRDHLRVSRLLDQATTRVDTLVAILTNLKNGKIDIKELTDYDKK